MVESEIIHGSKTVTALIAVLASLYICPAEARDPKVVREFRRDNPCPSTGKTRGRCFQYQVDHLIPLCFDPSGDVVENLQWLSITDHKAKTKLDLKACIIRRKLRRGK